MTTIREIRLFTNTLDKFIEFLGDNFIEIKDDLIQIKDIITLLKITNPQVMMEQYKAYVSVYSSEIEECNDAFFLNLPQDLFKESSMCLKLFHKIKQIWSSNTTTDTQKATIWFYIKTLLRAVQ
jgi:hypothetical protein